MTHDKTADLVSPGWCSRKGGRSLAWRIQAGFFVALIALAASAKEARSDDQEIPFDEAEIFFELNDSDGDLGIHAKIDGGPWKQIQIEDPRNRRMLAVWTLGRLRKQALTELFFESAEPVFADLDPVDFFARFPEGVYEVEGRSENNEELQSETRVTHLMPAPAEPKVNYLPKSEECDEEDPETKVMVPVTISWPEIRKSHPDLGRINEDIEINNYQVVVEVLDSASDFGSTLSVELSPADRSLTLPVEFTNLGTVFKYEVLARETSFNQTAVESCFEILPSSAN